MNSQLSDDTLTAADEAFEHAVQGVAHQISLLHKLSNSIRRASKELQNLDAARSFQIRDDDGNYAEDFLRQLFLYYIRDRFPTTSETIRKRLADTMILRRKRILYRRSRYGSTPIRVESLPSQPEITRPRAQNITRPQADAAGGRQLERQNDTKSLAPSATTLAADNFRKASVPSVVSASRTVALSSHDKLVFPAAPTGAIEKKRRQLVAQRQDTLRRRLEIQGGTPEGDDRTPAQEWQDAVDAIREVTCPICFYELPAWEIVDKKKWEYVHPKN